MKPKYLLIPGYVWSKTDGQEHFVGSVQLANLYGVPLSQCMTYDYDRDRGRMDHWFKDLIKLRPQSSGNYELPKE